MHMVAQRARLLWIAALLVSAFAPSFAASAEGVAGPGFRMDMTFPASSDPVSAVILMPGCSGNRPPAVAAGLRAHARALVARGFAAGVIDVLSPRGRSSICTDLGALRRLEGAAAKAAEAAARRLAADPRIDGSRIGFIGQSFGGSVALRLASRAGRNGPFRAVAAYYPWCADGYGGAGRSNFAIPTLILGGGADAWTPVSRCRALRPAPGTKAASIAVYPGAHHSFDLAGLPRMSMAGVGGTFTVGGNAAAASASRSRFLGFFARTLGR